MHDSFVLFRLECRVTGIPKPKITWFKSGKVLKHNPDYNIFYEPSGVCTLTIVRCKPEDSTEFSCEARNRNGVDITSTKITVTGQIFESYIIFSSKTLKYFFQKLSTLCINFC